MMGSRAGSFLDVAERPIGVSRWPIKLAALAALVDLGLSIDQIASYFAVERAQVVTLCARCHLNTESKD